MALTKNGEWIIDADGASPLTIGTGTKYPIALVQGLDVPAIRTADSALLGRDGAYAGQDLLDAREVTIGLGIDGTPDDSSYDDLLADLASVMAPRTTEIAVSYRRFGRDRRFYARPRGLAVQWDDDFHLGAAKLGLRFVAPDPVVYAETSTTSASVTGAGTVTNQGTYPVWPAMELRPTGTTATVTNATDDSKILSFSGMTASALYLVDFATRTILVGGSSDAYEVLAFPPSWWRLLPGANSITVTGATARFLYRDGYLTG